MASLTSTVALILCHITNAIDWNWITNNVKLNATSIQTNGIKITPLHSGIITSGAEWILSHNASIAFDLHIHMEWGLGQYNDAQVFATITSNPNNRQTESLLMAISANQTEYITMVLSVNNTHNNKIYPDCGSSVAFGNIENIANTALYPTRIEKITNGNNLSTLINMNPSQYTNGFKNTWPIEWNFINHPDCVDNGLDHNSCGNDLLFYFTSLSSSQQQCNFGNALESNSGLDIFIGVANPGDTLTISEIQLIYDYKGTYSPTIEPTLNPIMNYTYNPTVDPTISLTTNQPTYKENVTVEVEIDTKLNITSNSTVTHDVVKIITEQLTARFNSSILGTPFVTIKSADGTVVIVVTIEVSGDKQIDLDDDLINSIDGELEREVTQDDIVIKNVIIYKYNKQEEQEQNVINCGGVEIWCILIGIFVISLLFVIFVYKCLNDVRFSVIYGGLFIITVVNLWTDCVVMYCVLNWHYFVSRNAGRINGEFFIVVGIFLFVILSYVINFLYGLIYCRINRRQILVTMICVIFSGDTFCSVKIIHGSVLKNIKITTILLQNVSEIILQILYLGLIVQRIEILILVSICLEFICALRCFVMDNKGVVTKYSMIKVRFIVGNDNEADNIRKNFKEQKYRIHDGLSSILQINKQDIEIGTVSIEGRDIEIEIVHEKYMGGLYEHHMDEIAELLKKIFGLLIDIKPQIIDSESNVSTIKRVLSVSDHDGNAHTGIELVTTKVDSDHDGYEDMYGNNVNEDIETVGKTDNVLIDNNTASSEGTGDNDENQREHSEGMYFKQNIGVTDNGELSGNDKDLLDNEQDINEMYDTQIVSTQGN